jgi:hypothetical protein
VREVFENGYVHVCAFLFFFFFFVLLRGCYVIVGAGGAELGLS